MKVDLGAYGYGPARQGTGGQVQRPVQPRQMSDAGGDVVAMLRNMAAELRRLGQRVAALEQSARVLDANDRRLSGYMDDQIGQVNQKMMTVAKRLLTAAGRGIQPQQLVPLAQEQDYPIYNTPPRGKVSAQVARMMTEPGPAGEQDDSHTEPVDSGDTDLFYNGDDEEDEG